MGLDQADPDTPTHREALAQAIKQEQIVGGGGALEDKG